jgi:hypothetical protein
VIRKRGPRGESRVGAGKHTHTHIVVPIFIASVHIAPKLKNHAALGLPRGRRKGLIERRELFRSASHRCKE